MSAPTDLPIQLADLPAPVAEAVKRMARRLSAWIQDNDYMISDAKTREIITEELRPALLGGPLPPAVVPTTIAADPQDHVAAQWVPVPSITLTFPKWRGCIGTRYCHACKVSYGGTCLCMPNKCHHCGAECGTNPPAEGERYTHEMHY